jgi:hypothetical protein
MEEGASVATTPTTAPGTDGPKRLCRICGQNVSQGVLICRDCKYIRQIPRLHYFAGLLFAPLAVPLVLIGISWRMDTAKHTSETLAALSREMKDQMSLAVDFDSQLRAFQAPCSSSETDARRRHAECLSYYLDALKGVDSAVVKLSWMVDLLPLDRSAYLTGRTLKRDYWNPCDASGGACGVRGQIEREIYTLRWCPSDLFTNTDCHAAFGRLKKITDTFNQRALLAFCHLRIDVNMLLVKLYRATRATSEIAERLLDNSAASDCAARIGAADEVKLVANE